MKIAVVLIGYNRPKAMERLLQSVCRADYSCTGTVDLIMSLDCCGQQAEQIAMLEKVLWPYGEKIARPFSERQGLRAHVLQCGDLTEKYDAVVVLEDDLIVAEGFMDYVIQSIQFYGEDSRIAGISLYTHRTNPGNGRYFEASCNGYDAFLMQYAQSWGQCWTRNMWQNFRTWYDQNQQLEPEESVPNYVVEWNKQSWLKYYITYTAKNRKFFVYPYVALSTNASDIGEHCKAPNNDYQVPLLRGTMTYRFPTVEAAEKYDAFFEAIIPQEQLLSEIPGRKLLDLYGLRTDFGGADVLVSTQILDYKIMDTFGLKYRPQERNCFIRESGKDIFVYDLHSPEKNTANNRMAVARYDIKALTWHRTLPHGLQGLKDAVLRRLKKK